MSSVLMVSGNTLKTVSERSRVRWLMILISIGLPHCGIEMSEIASLLAFLNQQRRRHTISMATRNLSNSISLLPLRIPCCVTIDLHG